MMDIVHPREHDEVVLQRRELQVYFQSWKYDCLRQRQLRLIKEHNMLLEDHQKLESANKQLHDQLGMERQLCQSLESKVVSQQTLITELQDQLLRYQDETQSRTEQVIATAV